MLGSGPDGCPLATIGPIVAILTRMEAIRPSFFTASVNRVFHEVKLTLPKLYWCIRCNRYAGRLGMAAFLAVYWSKYHLKVLKLLQDRPSLANMNKCGVVLELRLTVLQYLAVIWWRKWIYRLLLGQKVAVWALWQAWLAPKPYLNPRVRVCKFSVIGAESPS